MPWNFNFQKVLVHAHPQSYMYDFYQRSLIPEYQRTALELTRIGRPVPFPFKPHKRPMLKLYSPPKANKIVPLHK